MRSQTHILNMEEFVKLNLDEYLVAKNYFDMEDEYEHVLRNVSSIAQKFKNIENYIEFMTIQIFVKNKDVNISDLHHNNVLFIEDVEKVLLLKMIYLNQLQKKLLKNKKILVTLIDFNEELNKDLNKELNRKLNEDYYLLDYFIKFSRYIKDGRIDFSYIRTKKENHYYVKGAKQSLFTTTFGFNEKKRIREARFVIDCSCGEKYILKKTQLSDCFYKTGDKLFYLCKNENKDGHPIEIESKNFLFSAKNKNERQSDSTLLIIPKYFKSKQTKENYIEWISQAIRGKI